VGIRLCRKGSGSRSGRSAPGPRENAGVSHRRLITVAALNNAEWCDAFCRTHGIVGYFRAGYWFSPVRTPRYYPDAITLLPEITLEQVLSGIDTSEGCSVKDSFAGLDLAAAGFRPLFRAHWLTREPADSRVRFARGWSVLTAAEQLGEWESAWAGSADGAGLGFFKPLLLEDKTIGVLAGYEGDRIVAEAVANRSSTVIGLSNVFHAAGDLESAWVGAAAVAAGLWDELPTVGYDSGDSLDAAHAGGFKSIARPCSTSGDGAGRPPHAGERPHGCDHHGLRVSRSADVRGTCGREPLGERGSDAATGARPATQPSVHRAATFCSHVAAGPSWAG
jgi:hypothetical protein